MRSIANYKSEITNFYLWHRPASYDRGAAPPSSTPSPGVEREIRAIDPAAGRKYLRDFLDAYRSYEKVIAPSCVRREIANAGIVLLGDYHALPNSQRYAAALLRDSELRHRPVVLGVETIFSRDQHILDEWRGGEIDEGELRQRIRFDLDWGYDWAAFYEALSAARERGAPIYGLDCMPREDLRKIGARDRHAADKIAEIRQRHPDALILALVGESHLAPQHLPALLDERLPAETALIVLQNVDALYWRAAGEVGDHVEAVEVRKDVRKTSAKTCSASSTPRRWKNTIITASALTVGDAAMTITARPTSAPRSTT